MDIHYEIKGQGEPVVLIHSGMADSRDWSLIAPELDDDFQVIASDGRGQGQSPVPEGPSNYVQDLLRLMDHLEIERASLVGHSIGGQIATDFSLEYPDRVKKLVLVAPGLSGFDYSQEFMQHMQEVQAEAPDIDKMLEKIFMNSIYQVVIAGEQSKLMREMTAHNIAKTFQWKSFETIWPTPPAYERLSELRASTLFVVGSNDSKDMFRIKEAFNDVADIRFEIIEEADHMLTLTHPKQLSMMIKGFINSR